jgi:hypothetical protein
VLLKKQTQRFHALGVGGLRQQRFHATGVGGLRQQLFHATGVGGLRQQRFHAIGVGGLRQQWAKYFNVGGNYVVKLRDKAFQVMYLSDSFTTICDYLWTSPCTYTHIHTDVCTGHYINIVQRYEMRPLNHINE